MGVFRPIRPIRSAIAAVSWCRQVRGAWIRSVVETGAPGADRSAGKVRRPASRRPEGHVAGRRKCASPASMGVQEAQDDCRSEVCNGWASDSARRTAPQGSSLHDLNRHRNCLRRRFQGNGAHPMGIGKPPTPGGLVQCHRPMACGSARSIVGPCCRRSQDASPTGRE